MLTVVTRRKQVKGHNNVEQQMAELKEVFAVYDDSGTGQLQQAEFVQAIMSAGQVCYLLRTSLAAAAAAAAVCAHSASSVVEVHNRNCCIRSSVCQSTSDLQLW